jgi:hypothetical protein
MASKGYTSFADFEREQLRPHLRAGWSIDELDPTANRTDDFDMDPFEASLWEAEQEEAEDYSDDE